MFNSCKWYYVKLSLPYILQVNIQGEWITWQSTVPKIEVETHKVGSPDIVVPTLDTVRHESLLNTWLAEHKPMVLCGPPGSGKTMTLLAALRMLPDFEVSSVKSVHFLVPYAPYTVEPFYNITLGFSLSLPL